MRLSLRGDNPLERLALGLGLVPVPAAQAFGGVALSGVLLTAARLGLFDRLATAPASSAELATELDLDPTATDLLLECLRALRHVRLRGDRYQLTRAARRWLGPGSRWSVAGFVAATEDYWAWWQQLPETVRTGVPVEHHGAAPDDPYWRRYLLGQYDLARLSAGEVARRVRVPAGARQLLDIGGGHGLYSVAVCRRHPTLSATVLDLPGAARVGGELVTALGMADRVRYREGDATSTDLGTGYGVVLCFNLVHHLEPAEIVDLLTRAYAALAPGGTVAVLDGFARPNRRPPAATAVVGLFMYLSSGGRAYSEQQLAGWVRAAGFSALRRTAIRRLPGLALYQATRPA